MLKIVSRLLSVWPTYMPRKFLSETQLMPESRAKALAMKVLPTPFGPGQITPTGTSPWPDFRSSAVRVKNCLMLVVAADRAHAVFRHHHFEHATAVALDQLAFAPHDEIGRQPFIRRVLRAQEQVANAGQA